MNNQYAVSIRHIYTMPDETFNGYELVLWHLIVFTIVFGSLSFVSFASIVALFIADWMAKHF